jgi:hypothetical protein
VLFLPDKITTCYRNFSSIPNHRLLGIDTNKPTSVESNYKTFIPSILSMNGDNIIPFPIPFQIPARKYTSNDRPWLTLDKVELNTFTYKHELPDKNGFYTCKG